MRTKKRFLALCLALLLACTVLPAPAAQGADVQPVLSAVLARQAAAVPSPDYGDEWAVLGLARGGYYAGDSDYCAHYYAALAAKVPELVAASGRSGALNAYKSTDNSRVILALSAIGRDATQVAGCDLTAPYADFAWVSNQGINGPIFALLALDSRSYLSGSTVRRQCLDAILAAELSDGGWALNGAVADPDVTAMALQALAAYRGEPAVAAAVSRGVDALSAMQASDGGFTSWGTANAESVAQVIVACTALGIDPDADSRFVKDGGSAVDALLTFYDAGAAAFRHTASGGTNDLATEQAVYALVAVSRFRHGQSGLYQETDVPAVETPAAEPEPFARVLCTADGSGLIPAGYRTVAVCPPDAAADSVVTFSDGTKLLYSPVLSERSDTPTWVWLFAPDVTDAMLNDAENYTVADGKSPELTFGDVNGDGVLNAQDALNIRTACDGGAAAPATDVLLTMDVNLDGRVDAQDVRALADGFVHDTALPTAQEDGQ